jgi:hypothetical protein
MTAKGQSTDNPYAECVRRTIKEEEVYLNEYQDVADARQHLIDKHGRAPYPVDWTG